MKESEKRAKGTVPEDEEVVIEWGVPGGTEAEHKSELLRLKRYLYGEIVEAGCGLWIPHSVVTGIQVSGNTPARVKSTRPEGEVQIT